VHEAAEPWRGAASTPRERECEHGRQPVSSENFDAVSVLKNRYVARGASKYRSPERRVSGSVSLQGVESAPAVRTGPILALHERFQAVRVEADRHDPNAPPRELCSPHGRSAPSAPAPARPTRLNLIQDLGAAHARAGPGQAGPDRCQISAAGQLPLEGCALTRGGTNFSRTCAVRGESVTTRWGGRWLHCGAQLRSPRPRTGGAGGPRSGARRRGTTWARMRRSPRV
jgi:hypothetical protein